jgi:two-component system sensor histidine kinase TctE
MVDASRPRASDTGSAASKGQPGPASGRTHEDRVQRSLFGEILDWLLMPLLLLWPLSIGVTYLVAKSVANQPFDQALQDKATVLAQQVKESNGKIVTRLTGPARDFLRADDIDNIYFQVVAPDGTLIDGDPELPVPNQAEKPPPWSVSFRDETLRNTDIRIAYTYVDLRKPGDGNAGTPPRLALVQVGETLEKRAQLANQMIKGVILPELIILPMALALVWFALARGLSPLAELQYHIRDRRPDDLRPIDSGQVPEEISPLVHSLNEMLDRLSQSIQMQKRFIADAAHQMKTPLAGMRMQSELALRETDQGEIRRSLEQLAKSSESATRLVNQLLALARAENETPDAKPFERLELGNLARAVVHDWVQSSFSRNIDLGFEQFGGLVRIKGNPVMLREMLSNLIDNALRYTPPTGSVTVRVRASDDGRQAILEVEDTGPGIPSQERTQVFERFYRILGTSVEGSGLGLAIVREIALQHDASIEVFSNPRSHDSRYPGSLFRIAMPSDAPKALPDH